MGRPNFTCHMILHWLNFMEQWSLCNVMLLYLVWEDLACYMQTFMLKIHMHTDIHTYTVELMMGRGSKISYNYKTLPLSLNDGYYSVKPWLTMQTHLWLQDTSLYTPQLHDRWCMCVSWRVGRTKLLLIITRMTDSCNTQCHRYIHAVVRYYETNFRNRDFSEVTIMLMYLCIENEMFLEVGGTLI